MTGEIVKISGLHIGSEEVTYDPLMSGEKPSCHQTVVD